MQLSCVGLGTPNIIYTAYNKILWYAVVLYLMSKAFGDSLMQLHYEAPTLCKEHNETKEELHSDHYQKSDYQIDYFKYILL